MECVARLHAQSPDLLILEAPLFWGGAEGVLQALQDRQGQRRVPVILVATGVGSIDWFQLSRFRIENLLFRVPTASDLVQAIAGVAAMTAKQTDALRSAQQEATLAQ